ncbi:MAG: DUF6081 family protein [Nocardiopsaceae bacterium]|jgi:hypothetical protein|nr:DUF6081 family protein [Nocardiopsaceae bacterium]
MNGDPAAPTRRTKYDELTGPALDSRLWEPLSFGPLVALEPEARTTVEDGVLTVDIPEFTNSNPDVQGIDNSKHVVLSTQGFRLPEDGVARFSVDLRAEITGDGSGDYRQGVAAFIVIDSTGGTHMVFDILSMGDRFFAEHEVLAMPGQENPFTRMIEDPFFSGRAGGRPDPDFRHCSIEIDRSRENVTWKIDDKILHEAADLHGLPEEVHLGFGIFTLVPLAEGKGSNHGQGARASWRDFEYGRPGEPG